HTASLTNCENIFIVTRWKSDDVITVAVNGACRNEIANTLTTRPTQLWPLPVARHSIHFN
ncbi:MAG: hypothetical protein ACI89U_003007, partial [Gammaproteobacteria bacterium]